MKTINKTFFDTDTVENFTQSIKNTESQPHMGSIRSLTINYLQMKTFTYLLLACLVLPLSIFAQKSNRIIIDGKIENEQNDVEGIAIYNENSGLGTITNTEGGFQIEAQEGDMLLFSALQYQKFRVIVDMGIIKERKLNIYMNEVVRELEEITVTPYDLTGNVRVDVARIKVQVPELDENLFTPMAFEAFEFKADLASPVVNEAVPEPDFQHGIDMANVFRKIFLNRQNAQQRMPTSMEDEMKKIYGNEFFQKNLNIPKEDMGSFIAYCETQGLTDQLIQNNNQIELLDFLMLKCKTFNVEKHLEKEEKN